MCIWDKKTYMKTKGLILLQHLKDLEWRIIPFLLIPNTLLQDVSFLCLLLNFQYPHPWLSVIWHSPKFRNIHSRDEQCKERGKGITVPFNAVFKFPDIRESWSQFILTEKNYRMGKWCKFQKRRISKWNSWTLVSISQAKMLYQYLVNR